jgi:hypothetical protein
MATNCPDDGHSESSGRVNPPIAPARYNFLCSSQGRPCGRQTPATTTEPMTALARRLKINRS